MPVPTLVTDLSTTLASNSPAGSDNVFPDLDNYLRAMSGFIASIRDNSGNGWVSPYLPLTYSAGTANGVVYLNGSKAVTTGSGLVFDGTNLGVGTSSPAQRLDVAGAQNSVQARFGNVAGRGLEIGTALVAGTNDAGSVLNAKGATSGTMIFQTDSTERARITSGGNLLVGTTADAGSDTKLAVKNTTAGGSTGYLWNASTSGDSIFLSFGTEAAITTRGSIDYNRAGGLVRYNTTSDYRAKDIIGPVQNPGATIDALKVYEGRMKGASQSRPMLIAHEAQEHVPFCVSGEKDEENPDGSPKFQQMDHASLVPLLLAEIQSLRARVAALEAA